MHGIELIAGIPLGMLILLAVMIIRWEFKRQRRLHEPRGFEVKPITGPSPVSEERDKNNG